MDLRQFQNRSQTQANLGAIPAPAQETSAFEAVAGAFSQLAPTIGSAASAGAKIKANELAQQDLGSFTLKLANAQQASQTNPNFDLAKAQRKIFQETIASNPSLTEDYIKTFKSVTGIEPAGMTEQQKQQQKELFEAQSKNFGNPDDPIEVQLEQLELYQDTQRESILMEHEAKKTAADKETTKREVYKRTSKLVSNKVQSLNLQLDQIRQKISNGGSREEGERQWMKLKSEWAVEFAGYGEFANDETVKAQVKGITDIFADGDRFIRGEATLNESQKASQINLERQKVAITAEPKNSRIIATTNFFGNSPALNLPISQAALAILKDEPVDVRSVPAAEKGLTQRTFQNMGNSEDLETREEVQGHVTNIAKHMGRNGEDYTDDELLEVCSVMAAPSVYKGMSNDQKETVIQACNTYAVDVAQKAIRDLEQNSSISVANERVTPRGTTVFDAPTVLAAENFASLEVDSNGFRYVAAPAFQNNRQAQRQIQSMNRQLAKVNPVLTILSNASGKSMESVAGETFGLGPMAATTELPEQPLSLGDRLSQWYEENFVAPTEVATPEQREAQARQLGQSFIDFMSASPEQHLSSITGQEAPEGTGTVLATEQPTEQPVETPVSAPEPVQAFDPATASTDDIRAEQERIGATADGKWGPQSRRATEFTNMAEPIAQELGADLSLLQRMARVESNFQPKAQAGTSSAGGYFQFIDSTWNSMVEKYGDEVGVSEGTPKTDPEANTKMAIKLIEENTNMLRRATGQEPTYGDLYLAHFAGPSTAIKAMNADPDAPASDVFSAGQIKANKSVLQGKTVGEVLEWAESKMQ